MIFLATDFLMHLPRAVSWALIHSLWQGMVVIALAGIVISVTRKSPPACRYRLLSGLMVLFVIGNAITFGWMLRNSMQIAPILDHGPSQNVFAGLRNTFRDDQNLSYYPGLLIQLLDKQSFNIATVWILIFILKTIQTAVGYHYNRVLIRSATPAPEIWERRCQQLAAKLGIFEKVTLLSSDHLDTPAALGFFRQMVIVPAGFLTSLPLVQIEAILLHELAHIRRHDYLFNALQRFCENIYFFNPAILWLSNLIRRERENCCDDIVVRITGDKKTYVNALVAFKQMQIRANKSIPAFFGSNNQLLQRIKRIVSHHNQPLEVMEKLSITVGMVAIAALTFIPFNEGKTFPGTLVTMRPGVPVADQLARTPAMAKMHVVKKSVLVKKSRDMPARKDTSQFFGAALNAVEEAIADNDFEKARALRWEAVEKLWKAKADLKSNETQLRLRTEVFSRNRQQNQLDVTDSLMSEDILKLETDKLEGKRRELAIAQAELDLSQKNLWQQLNASYRTEAADNQEELIRELIAAGIIKSKENLSYKLHNMFFTVNGVNMPEEIHQRFKAKYLKNTWTEYVYNWDGATGYRLTGIRYNG